MVNVDQLYEPQRMIQILGRIRRAGSRPAGVPVLAAGRRYPGGSVPERPGAAAALADYVFDGLHPLHKQLSPWNSSIRQPPLEAQPSGHHRAPVWLCHTKQQTERRSRREELQVDASREISTRAIRGTGTDPTGRLQGQHVPTRSRRLGHPKRIEALVGEARRLCRAAWRPPRAGPAAEA